MKHIFIQLVSLFVIGFALGISRIDITTWQFWIIVVAITVYGLSNYFEKK